LTLVGFVVVMGHCVLAVDGVLKFMCSYHVSLISAMIVLWASCAGVFCGAVVPLCFLFTALCSSMVRTSLCGCFRWIWGDRLIFLGFYSSSPLVVSAV
jgi:hypothetical protein